MDWGLTAFLLRIYYRGVDLYRVFLNGRLKNVDLKLIANPDYEIHDEILSKKQQLDKEDMIGDALYG